MPGIAQIGAVPGWGAQQNALGRRIFLSNEGKILLPGGVVIEGANARDPGNLATNTSYSDISVLRAGLLLGKMNTNTTSGKYAPAFLGTINAAWNGLGTTLSTTAAVAVEIARRIGTSGQIRVIGCATANTTNVTAVNCQNVAFSAINTTSGALTVTATNINCVNGGFLGVDDGSYIPRAIVCKEDGVPVVDRYGNAYDVACPDVAIGGIVDTNFIVNYPAVDTGLILWLKTQLRAYGYGWAFSDDF